jgi:hypothetical protein
MESSEMAVGIDRPLDEVVTLLSERGDGDSQWAGNDAGGPDGSRRGASLAAV